MIEPADPVPEVTSSQEEISVHETIVRPDGTVTALAVQARFDGADYAVDGSPVVETIAYTRADRRTILGVGRKQGAVALTETVTVDPESRGLTLEYRLHSGDRIVASGLACFEREA